MNIELRSITRSFGENKVVDGVSLRMLATVLPPSSGGIRLLGRDPKSAAQRREIRRRLGYLPQNLWAARSASLSNGGVAA
jgi:ABC-2 type transport system ATP-binding protein